MIRNALELLERAIPLLCKGALVTLEISFCGIIIGIVLGTVLGIVNCQRLRNPVLGAIVSTYVAIFRGTPMFVQLLFVYFALPDICAIDLSPIAAGIITLGFNSGAYLSETMRGGINAVAPGQWEAASALGYSQRQTLQHIILPQALKNVLPAITNELSTLVKDSSILMIIGVPELVKVSRDIVARELIPMEIYGLAAIFYLIMTSVLAALAKGLERVME